MKQLEKVQNNTTWAKASNAINNNNDALYVAVTTLEHAAFKNKGYFKSVALLYGAYPTSENGAQAFVYNSSNPTSAPYDIYEWVNDAWQDTGVNGGNVNVNLDSKQDTLVGYSESVSGGKATQVAIQGDTIALSGKVSLGNVDDMESAILMSSSQAGAAVAKANTVEQSMSALKSPVKPIHLNSQGKLELNIGKGLYVEDGKLCTTGASGGGGGGATLSEGAGISILNNKISVAYNTKTLGIDSCGGLTVNYGEGLTIKNGKLSAQASVNAGNGLVKKGDALQVSVGTGLLVADDVYVNMGKGLATDNENKVNVNLDEQTLTTDACGKVIVNKDSLIGNGLKQEYSKLAVNYGTGLALSNKAIVVNYGTGLSIQDGKLVSTVSSGKTYVSGQAININGNEINVKYDGVTISTKDSTDKSLHVMLGSGLIQGTSGIDVAVGSGLAIGSDNKLYSTVSSGKTYVAGDGINISGNTIKVNDTILNLGTRVYELGDFASSGAAENKAKEATISGNNAIVIMRYTVSSSKKQGVILQQVGDYRTIQYQLWDGGIYTRYVWFTDNTRQTLNNGLNANEKWWKLGATHTNYDSSTRKIHLANKDDSNINACDSAVIPIVSSSVAGLMSSNMLNTLNDAQGKLVRYTEGMSGNKSTASINADEISMSGSSLKLHNVVRVCGALFSDLQTQGNINIKGKSVIASNIDAGELKVLNGASNYGFILRTVDNPNDPQGLMLAELLSTDGYDSYKYTFPAKSGEVALKGDYTAGSGISINGNTIAVQYGTGLGKSTDNKLQVLLGTGLAVEGNYIRIEEAVYDSIEEANAGVSRAHEVVTKLQTALGGKQDTLTLATGLEWGSTNLLQVKMNAPLNYDNSGRLMLNYDETLTVSGNKLGVDLYDVMDSGGGLFIKNTGLAVNAGRGLKIDSCQVVVDYGTGLKVVNNKLDVDTSKIAGAGVDIESDSKKLAIGTKAAQELAGSGLMADGPKIKVKYGSGLTTNSCGGLIVDAANLTVGNADKLGGKGIGNFMTFVNVDCSYVGANFNDSTLSKVAGAKYIEFLDGAGGWFNSNWGKVTAHGGFIGNLTGTADTADTAGTMNIAQRGKQDECVPAAFDSMQVFKVYGSSATNTGGDDGWILSFRWSHSGYLTQIYVDVDDTYIMSIRHRRSDSTWTAWRRVAFVDQTIASVANGLAINSDRVLSLPNLTASVANGAVDGSKNGAQRVLNLNCGVIQIKLSTGLAIDDNGYLYIQDKYVTK